MEGTPARRQSAADARARRLAGANGSECGNAVRWAVEFGYRHIDTPRRRQRGQRGQGLRDSGVPHEEVFITIKFYPRRQDPVAVAQGSLWWLVDALVCTGATGDALQNKWW
jgi:diketogulonate reductase-like aldo/keto reductase